MNEGPATERMRQIVDKDEIRDVLMRYSRGIDRLDEDVLRSCYHEDSHDDHGHWKGNGHDFAEFIVASLRQRSHHTTHAVANVLIELDVDDPDRARSESYGFAYLRRTDDAGDEWIDVFAGRYIDVFERRGNVWRIASRVVVHDWSASAQLGESSFPLPMDGFTQGRRDRDDLVYSVP